MTPLQALDRAMKDGTNPSAVLNGLTELGFSLMHTEGTISAASTVLRFHQGPITDPDAVARTVIMSAILGSQLEGMRGDG